MALFSEEATLDYGVNRGRLREALANATELSRACSGYRAPTGRHWHGSVLFTSLCTRAATLLNVSPATTDPNAGEHWDSATLGSIARSLLEVRLTFFYLTEECHPDEGQCRIEIMNVHDCTSRIKLFTTMAAMEPEAGNDAEIVSFQEKLAEVHQRLKGNAYFNTLPKGAQTAHLSGSKAYLHSLEEIGSRCGIDVPTFRLFYQLWSTHAHSLPMAFYRMAQHNSGRGVHSAHEERYSAMSLSLSYQLLNDAAVEMRALFRGVLEPESRATGASKLLGSLLRNLSRE